MTKRLFGVVKGHREHIADHTGRLYSDSEVADLLNTVYENCNMYREDALKAEKDKEKLLEENKQLKEQREKLFFRERDTKNRWRELKQENEQLKKENMEYYHLINCGNCKYHNYDWFDDGEEFEVCEKGHTERLMYNKFCKEWRELE